MMALRIAVMAGVLAVAASPVVAQQTWRPDPNAPLDVMSNEGVASTNGGCNATARGNVRVTQGKGRLLAQSMVIQNAKLAGGKCGEVARLELDRNVFYVTPDVTVRANHGVYDLTKDTAVFTGDVVVTRPQGDVSTGSKLTVDLKTNDTVMEGPFRALLIPPKK